MALLVITIDLVERRGRLWQGNNSSPQAREGWYVMEIDKKITVFAAAEPCMRHHHCRAAAHGQECRGSGLAIMPLS